MKKLFNHTKRPVNGWEESDYDWDSEVDPEEGYTEEGEYYADGEEGYAEEGEYYADGGEGYTEEGEYYADGEEDYTEEGEYYADGEEGYTEEGEYYADGEEDYTEEGEYYADGEEGYTEEGEYYTDGEEGYVGDGTVYYEDDDAYNAEYRGDDDSADEDKQKVKRGGFLAALRNMSLMDRVIAGTGAAVLILALVTGGAFISSKIVQSQVSDFVSVGAQLQNISVIGESGLLAVADAQLAKLQAAAMVEDEKDTDFDYEETDYSRQVTVTLNMTSIQKDLKIKFTNEKTGKLVANVPFSVTVTTPDGKSGIWSDDDMDGIIYKKDITPGTYKVAMEELTDERYADYIVSTAQKSVEVKKDIEYKKVDVANEVKSESEIDAKKEDTAKNEVTVESSLQDTVAWVESKVISATYSEVAKSTIPDPLTYASVPKSFMRMTTNAVVSPATLELEVGKTGQLTAQMPVPPVQSGYVQVGEAQIIPESIKWESSDAGKASVEANGMVTAVAEGTATISYSATMSYTVQKESGAGEEGTVSGGDPNAEPTPTTEPKTEEIMGSCVVTVKAATPALAKGTLTVDKEALSVVVNGTANVQASVKDFTADKAIGYKAASDNTAVATVAIDDTGKLTVTGVAAGTAKITVTADYKEGGSDATAATATITVTVGANKVITLDRQTCTAYVKNPFILNLTVSNVATDKPEVTVESSDTTVMKAVVGTLKLEKGVVTVPVTLELLKEGSATLTVKCKENGEEVKTTCVVTVKPNPKENVTTKLKDNLGNEIYVFENNAYRAATYADYYKFDKFFVSSGKKYTGWQTIDGKVYYFNAEGKKVTGEQVIQGAKYAFASDGSLVTGSGALGIDVSKWNGTIDWNAVKNSGINYVIIRCGYRGSSQGTLIEDPKFTTNIKGATAAGLKVGVYFFTQAVDEREAVEEASMVIGQIKNYKISYPVFLDVEASGGRADSISKETRTAVCKAFCQTIQNAGYTAGIYANKTWLENKIDAGALSAYKIWLAQYASTPTYTGRYDLWQYRSTGKVTGISGDVDMNLSYMGY